MVKWTDAERAAITSWWEKIDVNEIGPQALTRLLIVYPWTQRHFATFGNLSTNAAILGNPLVAEHGKTVMGGLDRAVKNMDDIKNVYTKLSVKHSEKIHVDPDNFRVCNHQHPTSNDFTVYSTRLSLISVSYSSHFRSLLKSSACVWLPSLDVSSPLMSKRPGRSSWMWSSLP
uniref:Ba1 globin, like n=1 Tax=Dicentrarchus labrax TaxID=13489 RepID=A0A8P4K661_DICLA